MKAFKKELKAMKQPVVRPKQEDESLSFSDMMQGVKPLQQDKIEPDKKAALKIKQQNGSNRGATHNKQLAAMFSFSDMYQAALPTEGPMRYCKEGVPTHTLKQLRRGDYSPEMMLDLHGLTREIAKGEIAALIHAAQKSHIDCVSIMHGYGEGVLKAALPHYLIQHPSIKAFHQAPQEYGGQAALLVLIDIPTSNERR